MVLAVSPDMTSAYVKWGDTVTFDLTYNILKKRSVNNRRQWGLGLFSGMANNLEPVIFGWCLLSCEKKQSFYRLISQFIDMHHGKQPTVMITDQQAAIIAALR